jgi:hypothetical protein
VHKKTAHTHSDVTSCQQRSHFGLSHSELFEQVRDLLVPPTIAEIFHDARREMIRDDSRNLNLGVRPNLPALREERLRSLQEPQLALPRRDRIELAVRVQEVRRVVRVQYRTQQCRYIGFLPYLRRCFVPGSAMSVDTQQNCEPARTFHRGDL